MIGRPNDPGRHTARRTSRKRIPCVVNPLVSDIPAEGAHQTST
jgi:hypothetical protein